MSNLLKVSLRQKAVFIPASATNVVQQTLTQTTGILIAGLAKCGYCVSETLLHTLNQSSPAYHAILMRSMQEVLGLKKNWTPLVKGWDKPTGESVSDHIVTFFANVFQTKGTNLPCGHIIPPNTFPLDCYNGCPFCGMPFENSRIIYYKQGSKNKVLDLWTIADLNAYLTDLLSSKTALDATQMDSLKLLLSELPLPAVDINMKETVMTVIDTLAGQGKINEAQGLFTSPTDILRYLWFKHTGFLQIIEPKTIVKRKTKNNRHISPGLDQSASAKLLTKASLKLKYSRKDCKVAATWLNNLDMDGEKICELMHPKRSLWIRFIRALRLAEYSKRKGFEKLKTVLDKFYNRDYEVWQGKVDRHRIRYDAAGTLYLLKQRPGLFARSLFANMLWFGSETTIAAFTDVMDKIPARLIFSLNMYADNYFDKTSKRVVKPLGGVSKTVPANVLLTIYDDEELTEMKAAVTGLCILAMKKRFAAVSTNAKTIHIDPVLFKIPVSIGDRSDTIQDVSAVLIGTRFPLEGDNVRLFMQWGTGLLAQHLDMDLSCHIGYAAKIEICSYNRLVATGCKHSGDIQYVPDKIGTAEYIDVDLSALIKAGAIYVTFTCNAYRNGSISPNLVVGWMNSKYPMKISVKSGVAYDPSCVQHQVRIVNGLAKGLVFGVLDVKAKELIWFEMPFEGQLVQNINADNIAAMIKKLDSKLSIGQLLVVKAEAQGLQMMDSTEADEVYTRTWAANSARITQLLID